LRTPPPPPGPFFPPSPLWGLHFSFLFLDWAGNLLRVLPPPGFFCPLSSPFPSLPLKKNSRVLLALLFFKKGRALFFVKIDFFHVRPSPFPSFRPRRTFLQKPPGVSCSGFGLCFQIFFPGEFASQLSYAQTLFCYHIFFFFFRRLSPFRFFPFFPLWGMIFFFRGIGPLITLAFPGLVFSSFRFFSAFGWSGLGVLFFCYYLVWVFNRVVFSSGVFPPLNFLWKKAFFFPRGARTFFFLHHGSALFGNLLLPFSFLVCASRVLSSFKCNLGNLFPILPLAHCCFLFFPLCGTVPFFPVFPLFLGKVSVFSFPPGFNAPLSILFGEVNPLFFFFLPGDFLCFFSPCDVPASAFFFSFHFTSLSPPLFAAPVLLFFLVSWDGRWVEKSNFPALFSPPFSRFFVSFLFPPFLFHMVTQVFL